MQSFDVFQVKAKDLSLYVEDYVGMVMQHHAVNSLQDDAIDVDEFLSFQRVIKFSWQPAAMQFQI